MGENENANPLAANGLRVPASPVGRPLPVMINDLSHSLCESLYHSHEVVRRLYLENVTLSPPFASVERPSRSDPGNTSSHRREEVGTVVHPSTFNRPSCIQSGCTDVSTVGTFYGCPFSRTRPVTISMVVCYRWARWPGHTSTLRSPAAPFAGAAPVFGSGSAPAHLGR